MAKFPITSNDSRQSIADALNYTLSGPSGLGQNFKGFSSSTPASLTGNFRPPFTQTGIANLFVAPITLSTSEWVDGRTFKMTFATTQSSPPFALGNNLDQTGTDIGFYNGSWGNIGVVECTTTYVIVRTQQSYPNPGTGTGGTIEYNRNGVFLSTDCNAKVTVDSGTARVFVSGQIDLTLGYEASGSSDLAVVIEIDRYFGFTNNDPTNPDYIFIPSGTVAQKIYTFESLTGTGSIPVETIFSTLIDQPKPAYYWYILEVEFTSTGGNAGPTSCEFGLRSLAAQVVKE